MKILVVKRDKLGDLLLTTPLFKALRGAFPAATIDLLANDYNSWVAQGHPALNRIWVYPRVRAGEKLRWLAIVEQVRLYFALRREHYDVVIVGQGEESPRAIKRGLWVGAPRTIAYAADAHHYGERLTDILTPPVAGHELDRMLDLLRPLGVEPPPGETPEYRWTDASLQFAQQWLQDRKIALGGYVIVGLGARQLRKQPNAEQMRAWAKLLAESYQLQVVLMWTPGQRADANYPGDDAVVQPLLQDCPMNVHPFRGPIQEALGLIFCARTNIFPDSGLMHFAAASPGGVLGLFANEENFVTQWAPRGRRVAYLNAPAGVPGISHEEIMKKLTGLIADSPAAQN